MNPDKAERIGIVVVHGVGATEEGWIDGFLVPELQKWAAYASVGSLARKDPKNDLVFVVATADRPIAIALGNDDDFAKCCEVAGISQMFKHEDFDTRQERLARRDELGHYLAWTFSLHGAGVWLKDLREAGVPAIEAFESYSEVHRVRDPESSDPTRTWRSYTRRWRLGAKDVVITELFWADLSRVGSTQASRAAAFVELLLESPSILSRAFMNGSDKGVHAAVRWLILASTWIMRWPIAGISVAVFATSFALILLQAFKREAWLHAGVGASLLLVVAGGILLFRRNVHRRVGLADLSLASALYSAVLLVALVAATHLAPSHVATPAQFLVSGAALALIAWTMWTITIVSAILLILLMVPWRLVRRRTTADPPLTRGAAAISLSVLLGIFWKFALTLLGVLMIATLVPGLTVTDACTPGTTLATAASEGASPNCMLAFVRELLIDVGVLNGAMIVAVLLAAGLVVAARLALKGLCRSRARDGTLKLPRLIASPLIVAVLFAGTLVNAWIFYVHGYENLEIARSARSWLGPEMLASGSVGLVLFMALLQRLIEQLDGVVHIGRDLVDHQYAGEPAKLANLLVPAAERHVSEGGEQKPYPRRLRIQRRLEALMDNTILGQNADRLVLVAHSQGTVIVHDYLSDHDKLTPPQHNADAVLADVRQIDVITVGSPLTHLYRHYFRDYEIPEAVDPAKPPLLTRVNSWTNLFRIDDPIGNEVDIIDGILNIGLGPGGHVDYWKEDAVCAKLWALIHNLDEVRPAGSITRSRPWGE
ncbi:MAG: CoA transferase [Hyphomicrobiaceae bacterium]